MPGFCCVSVLPYRAVVGAEGAVDVKEALKRTVTHSIEVREARNFGS